MVKLGQMTNDRELGKRFLLTHEAAKLTAKHVAEHNASYSIGYCKYMLAELHDKPLSVIRCEGSPVALIERRTPTSRSQARVQKVQKCREPRLKARV